MPHPTDLQKAIDNIAQKKHVISESAIRAKESKMDLDDEEETSQHIIEQSLPQSSQQTRQLIEFNKGITLLADIFKQSQFDELIFMAAQPARIFVLNFCLGILRGLGFALGIILIVVVLFYSLSDVLTYEFLSKFLEHR